MAEPKKSKGRNKGWDNLKPAKKGEVRNPNGRRGKGESLSEIIREELDKKSDFAFDCTRLRSIIEKAIQQAEGGDDKARSFLIDRGFGKVQESLKIEKDETDEKFIYIIPSFYPDDDKRS